MPSLTNFLTDKTSTFKYKCNKIVKQHYLELWTKQAHSLKEGKLRTYLKIKTNFGYENYLSIIKNFEQRRRLSKLRISAHKLQIEIERYQGTLRENRICCRCTSGQVEDEIHYLLHCTRHTNHREIFTTYLTSECQNFQNLDDKCKLIWILNNEDPTILRYLCQYLLSTTIWLNGIGDLQTGPPALSMRKKIFFLTSSLNARCWLSKSSDPFPCCVSLPFPSTSKFFYINMAGLH